MATSPNKFKKIAFVASDVPEAVASLKRLKELYGSAPVQEADAIVALGGDGLMLQTLHTYTNDRVPIYGMNRGSVGFLMNEYSEDNLFERLANATVSIIHPLKMNAINIEGEQSEAIAFNEVSLFRQSHQAAKLQIAIDNKTRLEELISDGVLVATPAGSTAYNLSVQGPILPIESSLLALTPISPFRPRRWRGALLPNHAKITVTALEPQRRPVSAVADHFEVPNIQRVDIEQARQIDLLMMFDPGHSLDERVIIEQFRD